MPDQNTYVGASSLSLAADVKVLMASLYNVETSLINAHNGSLPPDLRSWFIDIREPLKENLELMIQLFQDTFAFGKRLLFLQKSMSTADRKDCLHFLKGMADMSDRALIILKDVIQRHVHISDQFSKKRSSFEKTLCQLEGKPSELNSRVGGIQSYGVLGAFKVQETQGDIFDAGVPAANSFTQLEGASKSPRGRGQNMQTWVEANVAAVNPDGLEALKKVSMAFDSISDGLLRFNTCWTLAWRECQSPSITAIEAAGLASRWNQDVEDVKVAIAQVAESSDAILVTAVGAPSPPEKHAIFRHSSANPRLSSTLQPAQHLARRAPNIINECTALVPASGGGPHLNEDSSRYWMVMGASLMVACVLDFCSAKS